MSRFALLLAAAAAACGGSSKPVPVALPPDKPQPPAETMQAKPNEEPAQPKPDVKPAMPQGPVDVSIPAYETTVKLVSKGKGKAAPLRYSAKAGGKQQIELALDYGEKETQDTQSQEQTVPTVVLLADVETKAVDKDGKAEFGLAVTGTDARDVKGGGIPIDKMKGVLTGLVGVTMGGTIGANGSTGEVKIHLEKPDEATLQALELVRLTLPRWPSLPAEPVGVGAKWTATTQSKLAGKLDITETTDYELVAHKGATWTIKGTTKIAGQDADMQGGKVSKIAGTGTTEATIADGALVPTFKTITETSFTASDSDKDSPKSMQFAFKMGATVTPK